MKKVYEWASVVLVVFAAVMVVSPASGWIFFQPKAPKSLK